jgi:hypothetical protein
VSTGACVDSATTLLFVATVVFTELSVISCLIGAGRFAPLLVPDVTFVDRELTSDGACCTGRTDRTGRTGCTGCTGGFCIRGRVGFDTSTEGMLALNCRILTGFTINLFLVFKTFYRHKDTKNIYKTT